MGMREDENLRVIPAKEMKAVTERIKAASAQMEQADLSAAAAVPLMSVFLKALSELLTMQTDTLMTNAVKNKIQQLIELCLTHTEVLAARGYCSEDSCELLKDASIYFLRRQREKEACRVADVFKPLAAQHKERLDFIFHLVGMIGCLAMKEKLFKLALQCVDIIVAGVHDLQAGDEAIEITALDMLQEMAAMAGRMRNEDLFSEVIARIVSRYANEKRVLAGKRMETFLLALLFIASDRRYLRALPTLRWMTLLLTRNASMSTEEQQKFLKEWGILVAQMACRGWQDVTKILLDGICVFLTREKNRLLTRGVMTEMAIHFQMHSRWEGFGGTFKIYQPWHNFLLVALDRAVKGHYASQEERLDDLAFILRNQRDVIINSARLTMKEEAELYQQWLNLWLAETKDNPRRGKRARRFVQMTAQYWHMTLPRSSKKQWPLMRSLFTPSAISWEHWRYLFKVV